MDFGNLVRRLRKERSLTLKQVEELTGISFSQLGKIERGVHKPSQDTMDKLNQFFKIYEFIGDEIKGNYLKYESPINAITRVEVFVRDAFLCQMCGGKKPEKSLNVYHITPIELGGSSAEENLITLCNDCFSGRQEFIKKYGIDQDPLKQI
ncbi:helix-turn-helix domain-containing protein [Ferdinandcohnia sp. SAFN-114]|uniref:helix-turn-helix domain-containing protein n=1 Tax=Ferdinandcohnia sp. SAFN-114 TaxID=3387275 RepID=UPI003F7CF737